MIALALVIAYLLGSLNTSVLVSKYLLRDDIRKYGSGNPGTSNMARQFGVKYGLLVLAGDMLKGLLAVLIGRWMCGEPGTYYCAIAAVIGHNWPIYYKFKGGKGVATTCGAMLVILPLWTAIGCALFLVVLLVTRYFSLASLISLLFVWVMVLVTNFSNVAMVMTMTVMTLLAVYRHHDNIKRLLNGTEKKL